MRSYFMKTGKTTKIPLDDARFGRQLHKNVVDRVPADMGEGENYNFGVITAAKPSKATNAVYSNFLFDLHDLMRVLVDVRNKASPMSARLCLHLGTFGFEIAAFASIAALDPRREEGIMQSTKKPVQEDFDTTTEAYPRFETSLGVTAKKDDNAKEAVLAQYLCERKRFTNDRDQLSAIAAALNDISVNLVKEPKVFYEGKTGVAIRNSPFVIDDSALDIRDKTLAFHTSSQIDLTTNLGEQAQAVRELLVGYYVILTPESRAVMDGNDDHMKMDLSLFEQNLKKSDGNVTVWKEAFDKMGSTLFDVLSSLIVSSLCIKLRMSLSATALKMETLRDRSGVPDPNWCKRFSVEDVGRCATFIETDPKVLIEPLLKLFHVELAIGYFLLKRKPFLTEEEFVQV